MGSVLRSMHPGRRQVHQANPLLTQNYAKELFLHKYVGSHSPRRCMNEQLANDFRLEEKVMKKHMEEVNEGKRSLLSDGKRYILVEWLHEAIQVYSLKRITFWLSLAILDTFLKNTDRQLRGKRLQLVCCACFLAAVKQEETVFQTDSFGGLEHRFGIKLGRHSREHLYSLLMTTELHVLNTVNFDVMFPSCVGFVNQFFSKLVLLEGMDRERRGCKDEQADVRQLRTCHFLLDLSALDLRFHDCKPSERAATVVFLSILLRGAKEAQDVWWNLFESVTFVSMNQLTNLAARIIHLVTREAKMPSTMFEWYCRPEHRGVAKMCISRMKVLVNQKISVPTASNPLRRENTKNGCSSEAQTGASPRSYTTSDNTLSLLSPKKPAFEKERKQEHEQRSQQGVVLDQRMRGCTQLFMKKPVLGRDNSDTPLSSEASRVLGQRRECCFPRDRKPEASRASHNCPQHQQQEAPQHQQQEAPQGGRNRMTSTQPREVSKPIREAPHPGQQQEYVHEYVSAAAVQASTLGDVMCTSSKYTHRQHDQPVVASRVVHITSSTIGDSDEDSDFNSSYSDDTQFSCNDRGESTLGEPVTCISSKYTHRRQEEPCVTSSSRMVTHRRSSSLSGDSEDVSSRFNSSYAHHDTPFPCNHRKATPSNDGPSHISSPSNPPSESDVGNPSQEYSSSHTHEREMGDATTMVVVHISGSNIGDDGDDASFNSSRSGDDTQFSCNDSESCSFLDSSKPSTWAGGRPLLPQASGGARVRYRYAGHDESIRSAPHQQSKQQYKQEQHEGALFIKTSSPGSQLKQHSPMNQTTTGEASIQNEPPAGMWIRQRSSSSSHPPSSLMTQAPMHLGNNGTIKVSKEATTDMGEKRKLARGI